MWELEPEVQLSEKVELPPAGFDPPERLNAFLDAVRWGAVANIVVSLALAVRRSNYVRLS